MNPAVVGRAYAEESWRAFWLFANYLQFLGNRELFWTAKIRQDGYGAQAAEASRG